MATQGTVTFNRDICKGCGLCVAACATHLLVLDESEINRKGYHPVMITDPEGEHLVPSLGGSGVAWVRW